MSSPAPPGWIDGLTSAAWAGPRVRAGVKAPGALTRSRHRAPGACWGRASRGQWAASCGHSIHLSVITPRDRLSSPIRADCSIRGGVTFWTGLHELRVEPVLGLVHVPAVSDQLVLPRGPGFSREVPSQPKRSASAARVVSSDPSASLPRSASHAAYNRSAISMGVRSRTFMFHTVLCRRLRHPAGPACLT